MEAIEGISENTLKMCSQLLIPFIAFLAAP